MSCKNDKLHKEIWKVENTVKQRQLELINEHYGEADLYDYSEESREAQFLCNPYEEDVWGILDALYAIDGITDIEVHFSKDIEEGYDSIIVKWE